MVYPSSNFVLPILNRGCFIQYHSEFTDNDIPPIQWVCVRVCAYVCTCVCAYMHVRQHIAKGSGPANRKVAGSIPAHDTLVLLLFP